MAYGQVVDCMNMYTVCVHVMMYWYIRMHPYIHSVENFTLVVKQFSPSIIIIGAR